MDHKPLVEFVTRSDVRTTVLRALAVDSRAARDLVSDLSPSRSGIYNGLDELSDRGLIGRGRQNSDDADWHLTTPGQLVVDHLERQAWVEKLLGDREYWVNHDISGLPERFRRRLPVFHEADLLRNPDNDPRYLERYWVKRMPEATQLWVGSRVIHGPYADATTDQTAPDTETRLIHHAPVLEQYFDQYSTDPAEFVASRPDRMNERVCHIPCSFMLTEELFTLSFPLLDGTYDQDSVLVGRDEAALRFGGDFFHFYWEQATPLEKYLDQR
jgi:predicted transcriptional regulator